MAFKDILGHEFQKDILRRAACEGTRAHAYLFFGPDGVGKKLLALNFAKVLNCLTLGGGQTVDGGHLDDTCDKCIPCRKIEKGIHPDVFLIEYAGVKSIKIDQIREEIENRLALKPFEGRYKVVIVNEAERMTISAQNAFLKTLEEPPPDSVIVLITSYPDSLLPTVRSRCQRIEFKPLPAKTLAEEIKRRLSISGEDALLIASLSGGSLEQALKINREILRERKNIIEVLSELKLNEASQILELIESVPKDPDRTKLILDMLSLWLRDVMLLKVGLEDRVLNSDLVSITKKYADKWETEDVLAKLKFVQSTWYDVFKGNANRQLALENLVMRFIE